MRFGKTLQVSIYPPWKDQYIDYAKLKKLLRESNSGDASPADHEDEDEWTEQDEGAFVEELVNVQLEKVATFQSSTMKRLKDETSQCEKDLEPFGVKATVENSKDDNQVSDEDRTRVLKDVLGRLDKITKETNELEKYSRINYTGFLKAGKKHDRKRSRLYRVGPLLKVRLSALPFNIEDYSPLLYRLSAMYSFVRQSLDGKDGAGLAFEETGADIYTAYKFWVHPENLLEVKTIILRRLPVLVYNPKASKVADGIEPDPTVTSLYFDDYKFSLYSDKVGHQGSAESLRLRWYGHLSDQTEILLEKKVIKDGESQEKRFPIKAKYVLPFTTGEYKMQKSLQKLEDRAGPVSSKVERFRDAVDDIKAFITEKRVQPMLRANYSRTAFEIPGDDRVRISIDTNLAFIREDALDSSRPCRDPQDWHRSDIDSAGMEYPFSSINKGEIERFQYAILEIKVRGNKDYEWVRDLMSSHLVKEVPRFSKFIHGTAELFEDYVNSFPFWLPLAETDIRTDPQTAFDEEQERKAVLAVEDLVVGSLFGSKASPHRGSLRPLGRSPKPSPTQHSSSQAKDFRKATAAMTRTEAATAKGKEPAVDIEDSDDDSTPGATATSGIRDLFPSFSTSKFARRHRALPPGIDKPSFWIKDQGPVKVEAKVWLANQRTFIKWQHVTVLLASLSLGLFNAAGKDNSIARTLAIIYTLFAVFAGAWGYGVYMWRAKLIRTRSPRDFDNRLGPIVVCGGLAVALILNFVFKLQSALAHRNSQSGAEKQSIVYQHAGEF